MLAGVTMLLRIYFTIGLCDTDFTLIVIYHIKLL